MLSLNPESALISAGMFLSSAVGPEKFAEMHKTLEKTDSDVAKTEAEAAKIYSDIGLDQAKINELSEKERGLVTESATKAFESLERSEQAIELANDVDEFINSAGIEAKTIGALRRISGWEEKEEEIRMRYNAQRARGIVASLPPGVASDTDIKLISGGFPDPTSNPSLLSQFLRTYSKLEKMASIKDEIKSKWIEENRTLGKAKFPFELNGIMSKKGQS